MSEKIIAEMYLQLKMINTEVSQIKSILAGSPAHIEGWAKPRKAALALQAEGVEDSRHLNRLRLDEEIFSESRGEIRNVGKGKIPRWEYNIPKCRKALQRHFKSLAE